MRVHKYLPSFVILCFLYFITACSNTRYAQDYKSGTDFSGLKTYSWRAVTVDISSAQKPFLQRLVDEQLQAQGYTQINEQADFFVDMQVFTRTSAGGNTSIGIGVGLPVGRNGNIGLGTSSPFGKGKQEGVIVIDLTQTDTNTLIWRGNAEGIPLINFKLGAEQKLRESIAKILAPFPPQEITAKETVTK